MSRSTALIRLAVALLLLVTVFRVPAAQSTTCTEGQFRTVTVGPMCSCEGGTKTPKERQQCIGGEWEYLYDFCGGPFCQGDPGGGGGCSSGTPGSCPYHYEEEYDSWICPAYCYCCYWQ